ncbi:hypothetical protein JCM10212_002792 [Sporobolomyces blumeae]
MAPSPRSLLRPLSKSVYYAEALSERAHRPSSSAPPSTSTARAPADSSATLVDRIPGDGPVDEPDLIVCFGWMDAQLKHMEKYIASYQNLFPTSPILLLQSSQSAFYSSSTSAQARQAFTPAVDLIRKAAANQAAPFAVGRQSKILVHVFSNGGCMTLKWLNEELVRARRPDDGISSSSATPSTTTASLKPNSPFGLPARAIVFDSCPGKSSLLVTMRAFSAPIRNKWIKVPTMGFLAILHGVLSLWNLIVRKKPLLNRLYDWLNSPSALPPVPRLYFYSLIDLLIPYKDVEAHARTARERGIDVRTEKFDKTPHVTHARSEPERYWGKVAELWRESGEKK